MITGSVLLRHAVSEQLQMKALQEEIANLRGALEFEREAHASYCCTISNLAQQAVQDARKQAARECLDIVKSSDGLSQVSDAIVARFEVDPR